MDHSPIDALAFDIDNTLYPFSPEQVDGWNDLALVFVQKLTGYSPRVAQELVDETYHVYGSTLCGLKDLGYEVDAQAYYDAVHDPNLVAHLQPDLVLDAKLAAVSQPKFAFTNGDEGHARNVLRRLGIEHRFADLVHLDHMHFRGKPDPHAFEVLQARIRDQLGTAVSERRTGVFEDSLPNLRTAKELGYRTIYVRHGRPADDPAIESAIDVIHQLREGIRQLRG